MSSQADLRTDPAYWYFDLSLDQFVSEMICVHLFGFESGLLIGDLIKLFSISYLMLRLPLNALCKMNSIA